MNKDFYEVQTVEELANKIDENYEKIFLKPRNNFEENSGYKIDSSKGIKEQFDNIDFNKAKIPFIYYLDRSEMLERKSNHIKISVKKYKVDREGNLYE